MPDEPKIDPDAASDHSETVIRLEAQASAPRRNQALHHQALIGAARIATEALKTCASEHIYWLVNGNQSCAICEKEHRAWGKIEHTEDCLTGKATAALLTLEALLPTAEKEE